MVSALITAAALVASEPAPPPSEAPAPREAPRGTESPDASEARDAGQAPDASEAPTKPEPSDAETTPGVAPTLEVEPLPAAPPRVDPGTLETGAWRGVGFFQIHIAAMVPLGGQRPGVGTLASAGGGLQVGWRIRPVFGLGAGLTTYLHDHGNAVATDSAGETVQVRDFGRLTLFDPVFARFWIPTRRKVEPRFDVGVLLGSYRAPFDEPAALAAGVRMGAGLDVWIGPTFSLDFGVDPRLVVIEGKAGVTLQAGMGATVHW